MMVIVKTPFRVSLFGGGSDYKEYYLKYGGAVIGGSINKYAYLNIRKLPPFFDYKYRVVYSKIESTTKVEDIEHKAVRGILKYYNQTYLSINYDADLPARSGIGSSSSFVVGLINGIYALNKKIVTKEELAKEAIYVEQKVLKENVGSQDQTFASYGGFNYIEFLQNGEIIVNKICNKNIIELQENLMLFFSGISRVSSNIVKKQIEKIEINRKKIDKMKELANLAYKYIIENRIDEIGEMLDYYWCLKKSLDENISTPIIDEMYEKAKKSGAIGGKVLGGGGGGFVLLYVPKKFHLKVREALKDYVYVPFKFEYEGSSLIFCKDC